MLEIWDDLEEIERLRLRHIAEVRIKQWKCNEAIKKKARRQSP